MVNLALGKKSETDAGKPSIFRMLVYRLGAVTVLGAAAVAQNGYFLSGKNERRKRTNHAQTS